MKRHLFFLMILVSVIEVIFNFTINGHLKAANSFQSNLKGPENQNLTEAEKGNSNEREIIDCGCGLTLVPFKVSTLTKEVRESMKAWERKWGELVENDISSDEYDAFFYHYRGKVGDIDKNPKFKLTDVEKRMLKNKALKAKKCFREIRQICRKDKGYPKFNRWNAPKDPDGWCKVNCKRLKQLYDLMKRENINVLQYSDSSETSVIGTFTMAQANGVVLIYPGEACGEFVELPGYVRNVREYIVYYHKEENVKLSSSVEINSKSIAFLVCNKKLKKRDILMDTEIISLHFYEDTESFKKISDESLLANLVYYGFTLVPEWWGYKIEILNELKEMPNN